ncbi:MAG: hypothetical protein JW863_02910 [Chitinispirillaceae bacterium]|nr:hypothetical protein [Chitinispirillaceae bacterium]
MRKKNLITTRNRNGNKEYQIKEYHVDFLGDPGKKKTYFLQQKVGFDAFVTTPLQ